MFTRRGIILGSASLALSGCGGKGGGSGSPPAATPAPSAPPVSSPPPQVPLPGPNETYRNEIVGYGALLPDPAGIFDLPQGFSYRILSRFGDAMDDGFLVSNALDGMGAIDLGAGRVALVRNHELSPGSEAAGPTGGRADLASRIDRSKAYDAAGGVAYRAAPPPSFTTTCLRVSSPRI